MIKFGIKQWLKKIINEQIIIIIVIFHLHLARWIVMFLHISPMFFLFSHCKLYVSIPWCCTSTVFLEFNFLLFIFPSSNNLCKLFLVTMCWKHANLFYVMVFNTQFIYLTIYYSIALSMIPLSFSNMSTS